MLLPAVQFAHGKPLGLLPTMVYCIQHGLRALTEAFYRLPATKRRKGQVLPRDGPCLRDALHISDCMVCIALSGYHSARRRATKRCTFCASLSIREVIVGATYIAGVWKLVHQYDAYSLYRCFPSILDAGYGEEFYDVRDRTSSLEHGVFKWLVSIRPSHLVY